jgi:hypothetical protein
MDELMIFASRISNLIVKKENETNTTIEWESLLESYGFKEIYENYPKLNDHQSFKNPEYEGIINKIFLDCIKENKKASELMLNDLLAKFDITKNQMKELFKLKFKFIETNPIDEINPTVFVSYSSKDCDRIDFDKITNTLDEIGFRSFIAKEDIKLSQLWENKILKQLDESHIIVAILSKNFKSSNYCDLELGIATHRDILVIPLYLEPTESYGFFKKYQSRPFEKYREMQEAIIEHYTHQTINHFLNNLTNDLKKYEDYNSCNRLLELMEPYFKDFSDRQVEKLVDAVLINTQLHGDYGKHYLRNFYEMHENKIPEDMKDEFGMIIR